MTTLSSAVIRLYEKGLLGFYPNVINSNVVNFHQKESELEKKSLEAYQGFRTTSIYGNTLEVRVSSSGGLSKDVITHINITEYISNPKVMENYSMQRFGRKMPLRKVNDFFCFDKHGNCLYHHLSIDSNINFYEEDQNFSALLPYVNDILDWSRLPVYARDVLASLKYMKKIKEEHNKNIAVNF